MTFLAGLGLGALITIGAAFIATAESDNKKKDVDEGDDNWYT